jgi:hypothetical protein
MVHLQEDGYIYSYGMVRLVVEECVCVSNTLFYLLDCLH